MVVLLPVSIILCIFFRSFSFVSLFRCGAWLLLLLLLPVSHSFFLLVWASLFSFVDAQPRSFDITIQNITKYMWKKRTKLCLLLFSIPFFSQTLLTLTGGLIVCASVGLVFLFRYRHITGTCTVLTGPYMLCTNKRKTVCVSLSLRFHVYRPFGIRLPHSSVHLILFGVLLLSISQISHSPLVLWLWTFSSLLLFRSSMCIDRVLWWCVEHTYLFGSVFFVVAGVVCILCSLLSTVRSWFENISVCFNSFGICFRGDAKHTNEQRHKHNKKETNQQQHGPPKKKHTPNPKKKNRNWANASAMIIITSLCYLVHVVYLYQLLLCVAQELNMWLFWNKAHFRFETRSSDNRIDCPNSLVCANFLTIVISR